MNSWNYSNNIQTLNTLNRILKELKMSKIKASYQLMASNSKLSIKIQNLQNMFFVVVVDIIAIF